MLIACSIFRQKTAMLTSRILKKSEFLKSQFMLVMSEQFTVSGGSRICQWGGQGGGAEAPGEGSPEAESFLYIFIQKSGQKLRI